MKENKELFINFVCIIAAFLVNALINFFLSSYIVNTVSEEAYGFVSLANTFINYFTVITLAINSMSSRFIAIEYHKNKMDEANKYYSATFWSNLILTIIIIPILIIVITNLDKFLNISPYLINDVKMLFGFLSGNLLLGLLTTNLSVSFYIKNKLYIQSIINMISYFIKAILLYLIYSKLSPYIAYVGLATLIATTFVQSLSLYYKNKLIPNIKIGKFDFSKAKKLFFSGIWNSITRVGNMLSDGLDLLITNLLLDASTMGILAIVKIIPNIISSILSNLVSIFMPNMTRVYAQESKENFKMVTKKAIRFVGIFLNLPIICLIVYGDVLFSLYYPSQNAKLLLVLSIISISHWIIIGPASIINNIFTIINKIKVNSILVCLGGLINVGIVYILLKITNLGIYAVVSVSCLISILRNIIYTVPYGAKYIGFKWNTFYPEILKSLFAGVINVIIGYLLKLFYVPSSWIGLLIICGLLCIISLTINCLVLFNKNELNDFWDSINKKIRRC